MTAVVKALSGISVIATLAWGIVTVSASSGTPGHPSLLTKKSGSECVKYRIGRECGIGVAIENSERTISPDGKSAYRIIRFVDPEGEHGGILSFDRNPTTGSLVQKQGTAGCIDPDRRKGCAPARGLRFGSDIVISPDGRNVYASTAHSIVIFDREPSTGELRGPTGAAGRSPVESIAISPDGLNVYIGGRRSLAVFDRDPTTGALTQKPGSGGTRRDIGGVIVSPDGKNVYAGIAIGGVATFDRDLATGALTRVPGRAGCVTEKGKGGCRHGHEFSGAALSISPDGRNVYGAWNPYPGQGDYGVLLILDRLPDGTLAQKKGRAGCFAIFGGEGEGCARGESLSEANDTTVSVDGKRVYVFNSFDNEAAIFFRHPSGRLTEGPHG